MPSNSWPSYRISSDNGEPQILRQETIGTRIWAKNHGMSFALTGLKYVGFGFPGALPRAFTFCPFGARGGGSNEASSVKAKPMGRSQTTNDLSLSLSLNGGTRSCKSQINAGIIPTPDLREPW